MKIIRSIFLFCLVYSISIAKTQLTVKDTAAIYFNELKERSLKAYSLWNRNLYGPMLLVNMNTREAFANQPDSSGILKKDGDLYVGTLPASVNISNTVINWSGKRWAMVILQHISSDQQDSISTQNRAGFFFGWSYRH